MRVQYEGGGRKNGEKEKRNSARGNLEGISLAQGGNFCLGGGGGGGGEREIPLPF